MVENILEQAVIEDRQEIVEEENIDVLNTDSDAINYSQASNGNDVVYQTGASYVEYAYQDEHKNGEAAVQVEYLGSADVPGLTSDATVEYVTLAGDITNDDTVESRVIGVLRDPASVNGDYTNAIQYVPYPIRSTDDPLQTALQSAEVDKVDLMHFQVLGNGEIVYERDLQPPPPTLFEDPSILRDPYERDSPMYTTLENANSIAYPPTMQPPSPSKYYSSSTYNPTVTSSSYYYPHKLDPTIYSRPPPYGNESILQSLGSLPYLNGGFPRNDVQTQNLQYDSISATPHSKFVHNILMYIKLSINR